MLPTINTIFNLLFYIIYLTSLHYDKELFITSPFLCCSLGLLRRECSFSLPVARRFLWLWRLSSWCGWWWSRWWWGCWVRCWRCWCCCRREEGQCRTLLPCRLRACRNAGTRRDRPTETQGRLHYFSGILLFRLYFQLWVFSLFSLLPFLVSLLLSRPFSCLLIYPCISYWWLYQLRTTSLHRI